MGVEGVGVGVKPCKGGVSFPTLQGVQLLWVRSKKKKGSNWTGGGGGGWVGRSVGFYCIVFN